MHKIPVMGFPLILLLACCVNTSLCRMSDKVQDTSGEKSQQECGADDVEMDSQLADDEGARESKQGCVVMKEEACLQGGGGEVQQQRSELEQGEDDEMSQDEGDNQDKDAVVSSNDQAGDEGRGGKGKTADEEEEMSQDGGDTQQTQQEDTVALSADQAGDEGREKGEGKVEATGEGEQQPADEGEEVMSQDEEDKTQTQLTQQKDEVPADARGDDQVGDKGGDRKAEETTGATGADKATKVEEMASQGSGSDSDSDSEILPFPNTLTGFGYYFKEGKLLSIDGDNPFVFEVKPGKKKFNQAHYEALGEVITEEVYKMLESETHLKRFPIPQKPKKKEPTSFIFMSEDALTNRDKLMILIHGSGVVRAGQWARSLIINDCIDSGTQIPYIKRAMEEGYGVIVLNTNYNTAEPGGTPIRGSSSPKEHAQYVWKEFVKDAKAKHIYIVAHSFGGVVTVDLMVARFNEFKKRVQKIAFTDSVHTLPSRSVPHKEQKWMIEHAVNWVSSERPVNEELESYPDDVRRRSAGTLKHVETSWFSFEHIFAYFSEK